MTRTWLIRLTPIVVALLQLAVPRAAGAVELSQCRVSTRVAPQAAFVAKTVLARAEERASERLAEAQPFTATARTQFALHAVSSDVRNTHQAELRYVLTTARLPHSRAPPAQS